MNNGKRILLISNSTLYGSGYLDHAEKEIRDFLGDVKRVLFVPFALFDRDAYAKQARDRFAKMGYELSSVHESSDMQQAVMNAESIFIGGGNTFRLLKALYDNNLLLLIRGRVEAGMPYIGSSAGSNVAGLTIKTTKDMPIVYPPSLDALGIFRYQISPHYQDPDPNSKHMGETQEERIMQFHEENETPVAGLREGTMLRIENDSIVLKGTTSARIFRRGLKPVEVEVGTDISGLLAGREGEKL
ncbi:MAG TPA: dipeptidase PepE [Blastocatellia bacterium]|nr:dipeptidase PepE [Blastocatellia bacterium]